MSEYVMVKRELLERINELGWYGDGAADAEEELRAVLAQEAGRVEPVDAILLEDCEEVTVQDYGRGYFATDDCVRQLYTSPPAPVSVVLPSADELRCIKTKAARLADCTLGANYFTAAEFAADAMIDKVKELNQ